MDSDYSSHDDSSDNNIAQEQVEIKAVSPM